MLTYFIIGYLSNTTKLTKEYACISISVQLHLNFFLLLNLKKLNVVVTRKRGYFVFVTNFELRHDKTLTQPPPHPLSHE